ncbi:hypothetical protein A3J41_01820 [candidate division TM6 bacterium RIFCSPHIGHO2_12_FULL_38_8]|nr:MAG: hypothetical protein A3J41_01820 [candidate division TM6 bacterium RIFCSPHIGHO2_12_FULL_38_8]
MTPLKNHNFGFSFIEIMAALALLSIFGTSLFLTQSSLFSKLLKTHTTINNLLETDKQLLKFNQQIQEALQQKKPIENIKLHFENKNPAYTTDIAVKPLQPSSKLFKKFENKVSFVQATIVQENKPETWWSFIYTATPKEEAQEKKGKQAKGVAV